jgi:uncharacterized membrane protein YfcA
MNDFWILATVIVVFATVQSLFGVGLLVFGTPTLLLLGYPFEATIAVLLPASITISFLQVLGGRNHIMHLKKDILVYCVPFIVLGLILVLSIHAVEMKLLVGIMLVGTAFMRCNQTTKAYLGEWLKRHRKLFMMSMGLIHGLSNMGGGLLTVLVSSTYHEKEVIRANIAYGYLIFAAAQLSVLALLNPAVFSLSSLILAVVSMLTYGTVGQLLYVNSPKAVYQQLLTALVLAYGAILICQRFI